mmetsp:Transcript_25539/g.60190  ORF Transcript_25539/g.60190 Transcript_25539/m.60190 type:complete len:220 (+) Transcript_25539:249-908(+)
MRLFWSILRSNMWLFQSAHWRPVPSLWIFGHGPEQPIKRAADPKIEFGRNIVWYRPYWCLHGSCFCQRLPSSKRNRGILRRVHTSRSRNRARHRARKPFPHFVAHNRIVSFDCRNRRAVCCSNNNGSIHFPHRYSFCRAICFSEHRAIHCSHRHSNSQHRPPNHKGVCKPFTRTKDLRSLSPHGDLGDSRKADIYGQHQQPDRHKNMRCAFVGHSSRTQ